MKTWLITDCSGVKELAEQYTDHALILRLDLNDGESMRNAVNRTIEVFGGIDVLVNNAVQTAQNVLKDRLQETENWKEV